MARKSSSKIVFVSERSLVPDNWVPLSDIDHKGQNALYRAASEACRRGMITSRRLVRNAGEIKTGPIFMEPESFDRFKESFEQPPCRQTQPDVITLSASIELLTDHVATLTEAVEALRQVIASQQEVTA